MRGERDRAPLREGTHVQRVKVEHVCALLGEDAGEELVSAAVSFRHKTAARKWSTAPVRIAVRGVVCETPEHGVSRDPGFLRWAVSRLQALAAEALGPRQVLPLTLTCDRMGVRLNVVL